MPYSGPQPYYDLVLDLSQEEALNFWWEVESMQGMNFNLPADSIPGLSVDSGYNCNSAITTALRNATHINVPNVSGGIVMDTCDSGDFTSDWLVDNGYVIDYHHSNGQMGLPSSTRFPR